MFTILITTDGKEGEDECMNGIGPDRSCDHFCDVIDGWIQCSCRDGYMIMPDGRTCRGKVVSHFIIRAPHDQIFKKCQFEHKTT